MMDKKQERLRERYEDALFAIMMDELASSLGQEALEENERLKSDPDAAVPEQIEKKCMQTIRNHYRKATVKKVGRLTLRALGKAAMVFGLVCALFVGAFAASEDVRITTMNLIVETFGESTDFFFAPVSDKVILQISTGWLPADYVLYDEGSDDLSSWFLLKGPEDRFIQGFYYVDKGQRISIDTEDAEVSYIQIQKTDAMLVVKGNSIQIVWEIKDQAGLAVIFSEGVPLEESLHVAEEIVLK